MSQQTVNQARGLSAESYLSGNFDSVNLYNGNLTLAVPIGPTYTVGGNLKYGLTLVYNSTAWTYKSDLQVDNTNQASWRTQAESNPSANAGHGWMLSLGALYPPDTGMYNPSRNEYLYVAPDGSEHRFNISNVANDGSYLRLTTENKIEFPDGTVHTFNTTTHQLSRMEDRFGNKVEVDSSSPSQWIIRDKCNTCAGYTRVHQINFTTNDGVKWRVANVQLSAFNGTTARYDFDYGAGPVPTRRDNKDDWYRNPPVNFVDLWMLRGVQLPANAGSYQFDYFRPDIGMTNPAVITAATLPTGGHYRWTWDYYDRPFNKPQNPQQVCQPYCPDEIEPSNVTLGVHSKNIYNSRADADSGAQPIGTFIYESINTPGQIPTYQDLRGYTSVTVRSPEGDETVNYFNLDFTDNDSFPGDYYSLPFSSIHSIEAGGKTLYLSQEIYKGTRTNGVKVRSVYVSYDTGDSYGLGYPINSRVVAQRVIYHDDNDRYADTFNSDWNGAGQFRQTRTDGSFQSGNERTVFTDYEGQPGPGEPWILNLYTKQEVTENGRTASTHYCFDQNTGLLKQKRTLKNEGVNAFPSVFDIFTVYTPDADGNIRNEKYYGGDKSQNAPTGDICNAAGGIPEYEIENTYSYGILATSKYLGLTATQTYFNTNNIIDKSTGFVSQSTDPSGITTVYEYDALGRVTKIKPAEDAYTFYTYTPTSVGIPASVQIDRRWLDGGSLLSRSVFVADPFGRVAEVNDSLPNNSLAGNNNQPLTKRKTEYNAVGWTTSVSEFGATGQKTNFTNFDAFGRARSVTTPDGKASQITYQGDSYIKRERTLGTSADAGGNVTESNVNVEEFYDRQGRLIGVEEGSGTSNARIKTDYQYDVGGKLTQVDLWHNGTGASRANWALAALGGVAGASSSHSSGRFPPAGANNGDRRGTNWGNGGGWSDGTANQFPDQFWVNFNGLKRIDEVNIFTVQDNYNSPQEPTLAMTFQLYGIVDFDVHYINENNQSVRLTQIRGNNKVWRQIQFEPVNAKKIIVTIHNAKSGTFPENFSRITELEAFGTDASNSNKQTRTFNYDNRGFLTSETHPEITGAVTYKYDSSGKITEETEGNHKLLYNYDKAGRIVSLIDGYTNRTLKSYQYYGSDTPKSLSKLKKATRDNWVQNPYANSSFEESESFFAAAQQTEEPSEVFFAAPPEDPELQATAELDVKISEEYSYAGYGGRISSRTTKMLDGNPAAYRFTQNFIYDRLGQLITQGYPQCEHSTCANSNVNPGNPFGETNPRTIQYAYDMGYLTKVGLNSDPGAFAWNINYHNNKMLNTVTHSNGVVDTYGKDLNNMPRVGGVKFNKANGLNWDFGNYRYDGTGNVTKIGADWFIYDHANRIKEGTAGVDAQNRRYKQSYLYDPMGNMIRRTTTRNGTTEVFDMTVDAATNRLGGVVYDAAGNALGLGRSDVYVYDPLNMVKKTPGKTYLYGPSDERVWVIDKGFNDLGDPSQFPNPRPPVIATIFLRGLNNELLREYQLTGNDAVNNWRWTKDYIYRGKTLLAVKSLNWGELHYHLDHLGSTRFVTNAQGQTTESYWYFAYGMEAQGGGGERLRFTGHERDTNYVPGHTLYYMHARYYGQDQGKFFSVDPGRDFDPKQPQGWNLYAYTRGNPINNTDPTGRQTVVKTTEGSQQTFRHTSADGANPGEFDLETLRKKEMGEWESAMNVNAYGGPLFVAILENLEPGGKLSKVVRNTIKNMVEDALGIPISFGSKKSVMSEIKPGGPKSPLSKQKKVRDLEGAQDQLEGITEYRKDRVRKGGSREGGYVPSDEKSRQNVKHELKRPRDTEPD